MPNLLASAHPCAYLSANKIPHSSIFVCAMIKEAIIRYFQEQQAVVESNWQVAKSDHDMDALHDLRVGIKRLKALYQVLEPLSDGAFEYKIHFQDIRNLFKSVGLLRDIQVQSQLFVYFAKEMPLEDFRDFFRHLQEIKDQEAKALDLALLQFKPNVMADSLNDMAMFLEAYPADKAVKLTRLHLKKRLSQARDLQTGKKEEIRMHELRTRIKQVVYILELLKLIQPDNEYVAQPRAIKQAGELLGQWHDHVVLAAQIEAFLENNAIEDPAPYEDMLKTIEKAGKKLLKQALKAIEDHPLKLS